MSYLHVAEATGGPRSGADLEVARPLLRLFAAARQAAGTDRMALPGATVGAVLDAARDHFGPEFAAVLATSRIWLNGDPADLSATVSDSDEIAVLPPVSGGI